MAQATATRITAAQGPALAARPACGRTCLYAVGAPAGREAAACARILSLLDSDLLPEALFPRKERWFRRGGAWSLRAKPMWPGYFLVRTADPERLDRALRRLSAPLSLAGPAPMEPEAAAWLESSMDASHVVRASVGYVVAGSLRVVSGPLVGREASIVKYDRHKRTCLVALTAAGDRGPCEALALDVPDLPEGEVPAWL